VGVTGFGGHTSVLRYVAEHQPRRILVLGSRLGELTSYWNPALVPAGGFVHVDLDPDVPGAAFPGAETFGVQSDVAAFLYALIPRMAPGTPPLSLPRPERPRPGPAREGPVRPTFLQEEVQHVFVDGSDALVMAEPGNALAFANHMLRFDRPGRYRVSTSFSSMGHSATGIVGAALAAGKKAVSIAGDGAMLMLSEVNTAVQHALPVVWVVQNDAGYNMCAQGMKALGYQKVDCRIPRVDLAAVARGLGAHGIRVTRETDVREALEEARRAAGPVVVDVVIDASEPAPYGPRLQALKAQGATLPNGGEL
jgi:acetolactate synthase-1/2/3 large subunit